MLSWGGNESHNEDVGRFKGCNGEMVFGLSSLKSASYPRVQASSSPSTISSSPVLSHVLHPHPEEPDIHHNLLR